MLLSISQRLGSVRPVSSLRLQKYRLCIFQGCSAYAIILAVINYQLLGFQSKRGGYIFREFLLWEDINICTRLIRPQQQKVQPKGPRSLVDFQSLDEGLLKGP